MKTATKKLKGGGENYVQCIDWYATCECKKKSFKKFQPLQSWQYSLKVDASVCGQLLL